MAAVGHALVLMVVMGAGTPCVSDAPPPALERYAQVYGRLAALNPAFAPGDDLQHQARAVAAYAPLHAEWGAALEDLAAAKRAGAQTLKVFQDGVDGRSWLFTHAQQRAGLVRMELDEVVRSLAAWRTLDVTRSDAVMAFLEVVWRYGSEPHVLSPFVDWTGHGYPLPGHPPNRDAFLAEHCVGTGSALRDLVRWPSGAAPHWDQLLAGLTLEEAQRLSTKVHHVARREEEVGYHTTPAPSLHHDVGKKEVTVVEVRQPACLFHSHRLEEIRRSFIIKGSLPCSCPDLHHAPTPEQWRMLQRGLLAAP